MLKSHPTRRSPYAQESTRWSTSGSKACLQVYEDYAHRASQRVWLRMGAHELRRSRYQERWQLSLQQWPCTHLPLLSSRDSM